MLVRKESICLHLDPRSLAVFRMALGGLVFALALQLAPDSSAFFYLPSAHPHLIWALLHLFLPLFSISLALGLFSRLCSVLCWLGVIAVQQANPHILYGADRLLHLLLYWSIFLPLSTTWSADAWLCKTPAPSLPLTNRWAAWAIAGQICIVYCFAALFKSDPLWTQNHNALFYALSIEYLTSPLGLYMRHFPALLRGLTVATLCVEFLGPFLLFIPFHRDRFRMAAVILFFFFHLVCMQSLLMVGFFPWVCATAWLILIPGFFWDVLTGPAGRRSPPVRAARWIRFMDWGMTCLIFFSFVDVLAWNVSSLRSNESEDWVRAHDPSKDVLHLDQHWRMYAPIPHPDHGWLVIPAELADGTQVDLFTNRPVSWATPQDIRAYLGKDRWRIYLGDLMNNQDPEALRQYGGYLVNKWNKAHAENQKVKTISIIFMKQTTLPNLAISEPERVTLYTQKY